MEEDGGMDEMEGDVGMDGDGVEGGKERGEMGRGSDVGGDVGEGNVGMGGDGMEGVGGMGEDWMQWGGCGDGGRGGDRGWRRCGIERIWGET